MLDFFDKAFELFLIIFQGIIFLGMLYCILFVLAIMFPNAAILIIVFIMTVLVMWCLAP